MTQPTIRHCGWLVEQSIDGFEATHPDFDLTRGDQRVVRADTLGELAEAIENWIDENEGTLS